MEKFDVDTERQSIERTESISSGKLLGFNDVVSLVAEVAEVADRRGNGGVDTIRSN